METQINPLIKHFRQPAIYIKLPSNGKWWKAGALELPVTGELPVYPMTARDELLLKTPDALLNGSSTVEVISSCLPNIKDAWETPVCDLDAILIAIRQATYGNMMEFYSVCPHCATKNELNMDLGVLTQQLKCPEYDEIVKINGLEIYLKPQTYKEFNEDNNQNFHQQRMIAVANDESLSDNDKVSKFAEVFNKLLAITISQVVKNVAAIKTEDGILVDDKIFINEFFSQADKSIWNAVKDRLQEISNSDPLKKINIVCTNENCKKDYITPMTFEMSNFFE